MWDKSALSVNVTLRSFLKQTCTSPTTCPKHIHRKGLSSNNSTWYFNEDQTLTSQSKPPACVFFLLFQGIICLHPAPDRSQATWTQHGISPCFWSRCCRATAGSLLCSPSAHIGSPQCQGCLGRKQPRFSKWQLLRSSTTIAVTSWMWLVVRRVWGHPLKLCGASLQSQNSGYHKICISMRYKINAGHVVPGSISN